MTKEELIRNLKYTMENHKNDKVDTFGTNISLMCKDVLDYLKQPTSNDCVSRKAVLDKAWDVPYEGKYIQVVDVGDIQELPPVTPTRKVGKWIRVDHTKVKCSNCDITHLIAQYPHGVIDYCPNCGSYNQSIIENER